MARNAKWTYEETLLVFNLYCVTPYGKIHHSNPEVIKLAEILGRTPDAVALKMGNIMRNDPEYTRSGRTGLAHGAKVEEQIWKDYNEKGVELIIQANDLLQNRIEEKLNIIKIEEESPGHIGYMRETVTKQRAGQNFFRQAVLAAYDNKCCLTGISVPELLIASHIKPWKDSDPEEKANPKNGLCLNALHDCAFDKGFITLGDDYTIIVCSELKKHHIDDASRNFILNFEGKEINMPYHFLPSKDFLQYHRDVIFRR